MKKTKLLTSLAALALVVGLGACEVNVDVGGVDVGGVDVDVDVDSDEPTKPDEDEDDDGGNTGDTGEGGDTGTGGDGSGDDGDGGEGGDTEEPTITYEYTIEVANAEELKGLEYDGALESQTGVELSIYLVTTPSEGDETKELATAEDVSFSGYDHDKISISGLLVIPEGEGETTLTVSAATYGSTTVDVKVSDITDYDALALAENLEITKEALHDLGSDPCSSWEAYKYSYNEDEDVTSRLLAKEVNGSLFGYSKDSEKEIYYKDGVAYTADLIEESYETEEASQDIYDNNLSKDELFVAELARMLEEVEENDDYTLSDITIEEGVYTIEISKFEDANELGTDTYDSTYTVTIINNELVSASRETTQTHVKGTYGEESGTKTIKEEITKVNADDVTLEGFDETLWQEEEDPNVPIVQAILSSAASLYEEFDDELEAWTAVHVSAVEIDDEDPDYDRFYLADNDGSAYGYLEHQETFPATSYTYTYITEDLARYSKDVDKDGNITSTSYKATFYSSIGDLFDDYQGPLEEADDYTDYYGNVDISDLEYELESDDTDGYKLVIDVETGYWNKTEYTYTYYADANCDLTAYTSTSGDQEDGLFYRVEECALEEVTTRLEAVEDEFDSWPVSGVQLQFTFNLENEAQSIPEGATVYYVEDNSPYAITTSGGRYVVDPGLMSVGTHTYSIIITGGELEEAVTIAEDLTYEISYEDSGLIKQLTIELEKSFEDYLRGDEPQEEEPEGGQGSASIYEDDQRYHIYDDGTIEVHQADQNGDCTVCEATGLNVAGWTYTLDEETQEYTATKYSKSSPSEDGALYLPCEYEGLPVTAAGGIGITAQGNAACKITDCTFLGIANSVTSLNDYAFANATGLQHVELSKGLTEIYNDAFYNCTGLVSITIPDNVVRICTYVFHGCSALKEVDIPESVTEIGTYCFESCTSIEHIEFPSGISIISESVLKSCENLLSFEIPYGVTTIGASAFQSCKAMVSISIPETVSSIGDSAFYICNALESLTLPEGIDSIGSNAIRSCTSLTSLIIPEGVKSIGQFAFMSDSKLEYIVIPSSLETIAASAFNSCSALKTVYFHGAESDYNVNVTSTNNSAYTNATRYYYDEDGSAYAKNTDGKYWHYDESGNIVIYGAA